MANSYAMLDIMYCLNLFLYKGFVGELVIVDKVLFIMMDEG